MGFESQPRVSTVDPYDFLQIDSNPDGTITRRPVLPTTPASLDPNPPNAALTRDFPLNPDHGTWIRLFFPQQPPPSGAPTDGKLPLILYYHGGGFVILSAATSLNHDFCSLIATRVQAIVASVDYRLAPEHRLPAAYDDAMDSLRWIDSCEDDWIREFADLSKCYIMGSSAGANMAYHVGLRLCEGNDDTPEQLKIKGLILHHSFFGGSKRTPSEMRMLHDKTLPAVATDLMWELALPVGANFDHKYCNPMAADRSNEYRRMRAMGWRVMAMGGDADPLIDRQRELAEKLQENGVEVVCCFVEGDTHGVEFLDHAKAEELVRKVKSFIESSTSNFRLVEAIGFNAT